MDIVQALYTAFNWRAFRTWGVSAISPWELYRLWRPKANVDRSRRELPTDWDNLQRPGYSPDFIGEQFERVEQAFHWEDLIPTPAGQALLRNNGPLHAYVAGEPEAFTSKAHNFYPGDTVRKQLVIINNSRQEVSFKYRWEVQFPPRAHGQGEASIPTGHQVRIPIEFRLPDDLQPGTCSLHLEAVFSNGEKQTDEFIFHVLDPPRSVQLRRKAAVYDPVSQTAELLRKLGVPYVPLDPTNPIPPDIDVLFVGKMALTLENHLPSLERVRHGLQVVVFEQTSEVLERRLGFRVTEYGLRQSFIRVPDDPILAGLRAEHLADWQGEATLLPPQLQYRLSPRYAGSPVVDWCGIEVPRLWRCGCRGNVASVLPEKPACGNFLPLVDGGFSLQYAPLLVYREGKGRVIFCQLDVTGRTRSDPVAERIVCQLLNSFNELPLPPPRRTILYVGDPWGQRHLEHTGFRCQPFDPEKLSPQVVLVVGESGHENLRMHRDRIYRFLEQGGICLILGLTGNQAAEFLPISVETVEEEFITAVFPPPHGKSAFCGISLADIHNRTACQVPLVTRGATLWAGGLLAEAEVGAGRVVFFQLPPYRLTRAEGRIANLWVDHQEAAHGKASAGISAGTTSIFGIQFGQVVRQPPEVGDVYTFAAAVKAIRDPVTPRLEVERAGSPWDRAARSEWVTVPAGKWTEVHVTFRCEKPFPEGWQAYLACAQDGALSRVDNMRLFQVEQIPPKRTQGYKSASASHPTNWLKNGSFEDGPEGFFFQHREQRNVRKTYRRLSYALTRILAEMGVEGNTELLERLSIPPTPDEKRYLHGLYADQPEDWDDPYRFFRW